MRPREGCVGWNLKEGEGAATRDGEHTLCHWNPTYVWNHVIDHERMRNVVEANRVVGSNRADTNHRLPSCVDDPDRYCHNPTL